MRDDYFNEALDIVGDPYVLVNMIWDRMKMLHGGNRPLVDSPETLSLDDVVLREIIEGRIAYVSGDIVVQKDIVGLKAIATRCPLSTQPLAMSFCNMTAAV